MKNLTLKNLATAVIWCVLGGVLVGHSSFAETVKPLGSELLWEQLTREEKKTILEGNQVAKSFEVPGSDWKNHVAYQWVGVSPLEAAAVFADYDRQTFLPLVKEVRVSRRISRSEVWVDYKLAVGWGLTSSYTVDNRASQIPERGEYAIKWDMVQASHAKAIDGQMRVQPLNGGTLFFYQNYTIVSAWPFTEEARKQGFTSLLNTVNAIIKQIKLEKETQPELLNQQVQAFEEMVSPT